MKIGFGKHSDKSVAVLVLKEPGYISWALSQENPNGPLARVKGEAQRLISIFDSKPVQKQCCGCSCTNQATRCSVYRYNVCQPFWWCDACDPYQTFAAQGTLSTIKTFRNAVDFCASPGTIRKDLKNLIVTMAQAKGLPKRVTEAQAAAFFAA